MFSKAPAPLPDGLDLLRRAVERNTPVELQFRRPDGELIVVKTRLIREDEDGIEADWPTSIGQDIPIERGLQVEAYFSLDEKLRGFASEILSLHRSIELNERKRIIGVVLARPEKVETTQRRNDHRLPLACEPLTTTIVPALADDRALACPIDADRITCSVADLSTGGMSLLLPRALADRASINGLWTTMLELPDEAPAPLLIELRHRRRLDRADLARVGFKFRPFPDQRSFERFQQMLQRHLVRLQRQRLRSVA